jgi:hypothetical protein
MSVDYSLIRKSLQGINLKYDGGLIGKVSHADVSFVSVTDCACRKTNRHNQSARHASTDLV